MKPCPYASKVRTSLHTKRILRKLAAAAAIRAVERYMNDYTGATRTGQTLAQIAKHVAKELVR